MDSFDQNDPLYKLLGKARDIEPRPNFTQNVMRAIRQEPQESRSLLGRFSAWVGMHQGRLATGMGAVAAVWLAFLAINPAGTRSDLSDGQMPVMQPTVAVQPTQDISVDTVVATELDTVDQLDTLLAQQDTSSLTDQQIAFLLY